MNWLDQAIGVVSPRAALQRLRFRTALDIARRHYEAGSSGRRTQNWGKVTGDANAVLRGSLANIRAHARDLVRNNSWAASGLDKASDHLVGWGIIGKPSTSAKRLKKNATEIWNEWANSTQCDYDGRLNFYGLQKLVGRSVHEAGEVLIRRRRQPSKSGMRIPLKLQLLEADFLDTARDGLNTTDGSSNKIIQGVEFADNGTRVAYWLFEQHPGANGFFSKLSVKSVRVPAEDVLHIYDVKRIGQVRGVSSFAPAIVRLKDFDEFEDATLLGKKIAACFAAFVTDPDGTSSPVGVADDTTSPSQDQLEPGMIMNLPAGKTIEFATPPQSGQDEGYTARQLRAVAATMGITYEQLTGDYRGSNFSSSRMARLTVQERVEHLRWNMLIPQMCDPVWLWAMEQAVVAGGLEQIPPVKWTPPRLPFLEPDREGLALARNVRSGLMTPSEMVEQMGFDFDEFTDQWKQDQETLDEKGLVWDSDPRRVNQQGALQQKPTSGKAKTAA